MNKNYFNYLLKTRRVPILFFFAVYIGIMMVTGLNAHAEPDRGIELIVAAGMSATLTFALPVLMFSPVHARKSADVFMALPISRREMRITSLLFSFAVSYGFYFLGSILLWAISGHTTINIQTLCFSLIFMAFGLAVLLLFNSLLFLIANNLFDGVVMIAAYLCMPLMIFLAEVTTVGTLWAGYTSSSWYSGRALYLSPVYMVMENLVGIIRRVQPYNVFSWNFVIALVIFGILSEIGLRKEFDERKTERAEQLSDGIFAYPLVINVYALISLLVFAVQVLLDPREVSTLLLYLILLLIYVVASFVYKRSVKLEKKTLLVFVGEVLLSIAMVFGAWNTHFFGLADHYKLDRGPYLWYEYSAFTSVDDLGEEENPGYDREGEVSEWMEVDVTICIPVDQLEQYREVIDMMDRVRVQAIDDFYENPIQMYTNNNLRVFNSNEVDHYKPINYNSYRIHELLSEEELKVLNRYAPVVVSHAKGWEYAPSMKLEEYLETKQ